MRGVHSNSVKSYCNGKVVALLGKVMVSWRSGLKELM